MIKIANLTNLKFTSFDDKRPFYLTENDDLTLVFTSSTYNLSSAIIHLKNSKIVKAYALDNGKITIPYGDELLQVGRLDVMIDLSENCKTWILDGIQIKETDSSELIAVSLLRDKYEKEITLIKERVEKLEKEREITL